MPIPGARYRVMTTKSGKKIRLAFKGKGKVVEAKNLKTGAMHTPQEFAADRARSARSKGGSPGRKVLNRAVGHAIQSQLGR